MAVDNTYNKAFCTMCTKRVTSSNNTMVCSITNSSPVFKKECDNFSLDKAKLLRKTTKFNQKYKEIYLSPEKRTFLSDKAVFFQREQIKSKNKNSYEKYTEIKFHRKKFNIVNSLITFFCIIALLIYGNIKHNYGWDLTSQNMLFLISIILIGISYISYNYFYDKEYIISINESHIDFNGLILYWNNILDYGILENKLQEDILICTALNGVQKIDLTRFDCSAFDIANIIETNKKTFHNKS